MKHLKKFESFNEGFMQKATDFIKDPTGKKREAAERELHKAENDKLVADTKAKEDKISAELNAKEKEYRSKLSPEQLSQLHDMEDSEHRHAEMLGTARRMAFYTDGYFKHYHNQKNKWDK
jgi:hypothetical protein